jgi:hypothetical protein
MQELIVAGVVVLAVALLGVRIWRFFTQAPGCSCSGGDKDACGGRCPAQQKGMKPG